MVVHGQMPRGRLEFGGRWTLEDSGRDCAMEAHTNNTANTKIYPASGLS